MLTGSPIWMALANVVFAFTGSKCSQPCVAMPDIMKLPRELEIYERQIASGVT